MDVLPLPLVAVCLLSLTTVLLLGCEHCKRWRRRSSVDAAAQPILAPASSSPAPEVIVEASPVQAAVESPSAGPPAPDVLLRRPPGRGALDSPLPSPDGMSDRENSEDSEFDLEDEETVSADRFRQLFLRLAGRRLSEPPSPPSPPPRRELPSFLRRARPPGAPDDPRLEDLGVMLHLLVFLEQAMAEASLERAPPPDLGASRAYDASQGEEDCSICLQSYERGETTTVYPCGHYFHPECIQSWREIQSSCPRCPVCRAAI